MNCNAVTAIPGCLIDTVAKVNIPISIHYTYGLNAAGKVVLQNSVYTTPAGVGIGALGANQTVSTGCCPLPEPSSATTTPGSKELLAADTWTSPADAFSVTVLCLAGSATIVTPDGTGLTMAEGEVLSWSRSDQVQTIGQITATAGADSLVHVTWHI